jgi:hypothetical protein
MSASKAEAGKKVVNINSKNNKGTNSNNTKRTQGAPYKAPTKEYKPAINLYTMNVKQENTVRAFLSGFTSKVQAPYKEYHLIHMQGVQPHTPVKVANYNLLTQEFSIDSDIKSAVILAGGVKAVDILEALLKMRTTDDLTGDVFPAVTIDQAPEVYPYSVAVCSLEAVYIAVSYVLKIKCLKDYVMSHARPVGGVH